jgi:hypothetical protein
VVEFAVIDVDTTPKTAGEQEFLGRSKRAYFGHRRKSNSCSQLPPLSILFKTAAAAAAKEDQEEEVVYTESQRRQLSLLEALPFEIMGT